MVRVIIFVYRAHHTFLSIIQIFFSQYFCQFIQGIIFHFLVWSALKVYFLVFLNYIFYTLNKLF